MNPQMFYPLFKLDSLSGLVVLGIGLFSLLVIIYSSRILRGGKKHFAYYTYLGLTTLVSILTALTNNLLLLLVGWGFLGLMLYLLINQADNQAAAVAKKTFIIVGGSDALMLLGVGIIYYLTGSLRMDQVKLSLVASPRVLPTIAYLCIACAAFAKAGAMPFHSWIPDYAQKAPLPVVAFLPASLDKLLGIYLLVRVSLNLFIISPAIQMFLMLVGALTIVAGVMMALIQHDLKRLLGYHAVSQVGYMVLGIGTGNPIGIAGGILHMLNNAVYKSCLFLTAGNVEHRLHTTDLDKMGGLSKYMPLTYISALVASLAISGVPPFNGFFSKWMIYQGIIGQLSGSNHLLRFISIVCLAAAMFGSGLTLASFMKLLHAVFLGQSSPRSGAKTIEEVHPTMWFPPLILAAICLIFGIWAVQLPLRYFIFPAVGGEVIFSGDWYAGLSTLLILLGLLLGMVILRLNLRNVRQGAPFTGGGQLDLAEHRASGVDFYNTVSQLGILRAIYRKAEAGYFDLYEQGKNLVFSIGGFLQYLHNGVLPTYLVWALLGMLGLFWALLR